MRVASSRLRFTIAFWAAACATLGAATGSAQSIDLSLNVFYSNPTNPASGGTWDLIAKSSPSPSTYGIAGLAIKLSNVNNDAVVNGPRATVNGGDLAGFQFLGSALQPSFREFVVAQLPSFLPSPTEQAYFYGVGTLANGAPNYPGKPVGSNTIGPAFTTLTNPQNIAWASTPDPFGDAAWSTAVRMLSGTFASGVTPEFFTGSTGNVFTSLPLTNTSLGNTASASAITTVVRTNIVQASADFNRNGVVDAADYALWRKTEGQAAVPPGSGADGNFDGTVNLADYTIWRTNFGNPPGSGADSDLASTTVPEPAGGILLTIAALLISTCRTGRFSR